MAFQKALEWIDSSSQRLEEERISFARSSPFTFAYEYKISSELSSSFMFASQVAFKLLEWAARQGYVKAIEGCINLYRREMGWKHIGNKEFFSYLLAAKRQLKEKQLAASQGGDEKKNEFKTEQKAANEQLLTGPEFQETEESIDFFKELLCPELKVDDEEFEALAPQLITEYLEAPSKNIEIEDKIKILKIKTDTFIEEEKKRVQRWEKSLLKTETLTILTTTQSELNSIYEECRKKTREWKNCQTDMASVVEKNLIHSNYGNEHRNYWTKLGRILLNIILMIPVLGCIIRDAEAVNRTRRTGCGFFFSLETTRKKNAYDLLDQINAEEIQPSAPSQNHS